MRLDKALFMAGETYMNRGYGTSGSLGEAYMMQQLIVNMVLLTLVWHFRLPYTETGLFNLQQIYNF